MYRIVIDDVTVLNTFCVTYERERERERERARARGKGKERERAFLLIPG